MRMCVLALAILPLAAPAAFADGYCLPGESHLEECKRAKAYRPHRARAFYPPTYLVDGRVYYYFPGEGGRPDEPAQPIPEYVYEDRHFWFW